MKKATVILLVFLLLILFVPIPSAALDDGGTRIYSALTYKIVVWNKLVSEYDENGEMVSVGKYHKVSFYIFPNNFKDYNQLWEIEQAK